MSNENHKNEIPQGDVHTDAETANQQKGEKTKNLDDLLAGDKALQSDFDRKITQALETAKLKWEQKAKEDASEAVKLEKMSAQEKAKYNLDKEKAELENARREFAHEQLKTAVASELVKRGYTADFALFLTGNDAETSNANITAFDTAFKEAVEAATAEKLRGDYVPPAQREHDGNDIPPKDFHAYEAWRKKNA